MLYIKTVFSERIATMLKLVEQTNKGSVLVIQQFPIIDDHMTKIPEVRESISSILAFIELGDVAIFHEIIAMADGVFDNIVLDVDIKLPISPTLLQSATKNIKQSRLFTYSDINTWADSALQFILQREKILHGKRIKLLGSGLLYEALLHRLAFFGVEFLMNDSDNIEVLIGAQLKGVSTADDVVMKLHENASLYDIGIGNFSTSLIDMAASKGHVIYRIDIRAGISSLIVNILETDCLIHKVMGRAQIKDIELVAGGMMGGKNAIIIDHINHPTNIIGVADGKGNVKTDVEASDHKNIAFVERLIKQI